MSIAEQLDSILKEKEELYVYHRFNAEKGETEKDVIKRIVVDGKIFTTSTKVGEGIELRIGPDDPSRGEYILEIQIDPKNVLILDYTLAKSIHGRDYPIIRQLNNMNFLNTVAIPRYYHLLSHKLSVENITYTSEIAKYIIENDKDIRNNIDGIIYTQINDETVLVVFSPNIISIKSFGKTNNRTKEVEWIPVLNKKEKATEIHISNVRINMDFIGELINDVENATNNNIDSKQFIERVYQDNISGNIFDMYMAHYTNIERIVERYIALLNEVFFEPFKNEVLYIINNYMMKPYLVSAIHHHSMIFDAVIEMTNKGHENWYNIIRELKLEKEYIFYALNNGFDEQTLKKIFGDKIVDRTIDRRGYIKK